MKSPVKLTKAAKMLVDQLMALTGWKVAEIYANDGDEHPVGLLIGDEAFYELMTDDN